MKGFDEICYVKNLNSKHAAFLQNYF